MKTYKVITQHDVYIGSFTEGEGKHVNFYQLISEHKAETPREAIEQHFNNTVYLPFKFDEAETNEEGDTMYWSNLVDENNEEPSAHDIEQWKEGKRELYSNNQHITIKEVVGINFK